jgi:hypothetical protein
MNMRAALQGAFGTQIFKAATNLALIRVNRNPKNQSEIPHLAGNG